MPQQFIFSKTQHYALSSGFFIKGTFWLTLLNCDSENDLYCKFHNMYFPW